ncbi:hypothetical protein [Janthinobacterium sp. HLX7-2]|uniref:hypothetical protein n=1 Tax=Janthinobacterium sp. HLX7-2 TaxID=1259331 RepID=UPI003F266698
MKQAIGTGMGIATGTTTHLAKKDGLKKTVPGAIAGARHCAWKICFTSHTDCMKPA